MRVAEDSTRSARAARVVAHPRAHPQTEGVFPIESSKQLGAVYGTTWNYARRSESTP